MVKNNEKTPEKQEKPEGTKLLGRIARLGQKAEQSAKTQKEPPKRGRPKKPTN